MERYITKSKFYCAKFNTAIFSDPIRIYFSNQHEEQALELYFHLQKRKNHWERFLNGRGEGQNYCYVMLYPEKKEFQITFAKEEESFAPDNMDGDYILGINGPLDKGRVEGLLSYLDNEIGFTVPSRSAQ